MALWEQVLTLLIGLPLVIVLQIVGLNALTFLRLRPDAPRSAHKAHSPKVSILIPARNEANNIGRMLTHILAQTHANFELFMLDDQSTDDTIAIACETAGNDPRFHLLRSAPLPDRWLGKNWACHQLAQVASGEILIFTDADVLWEPAALAAVLAGLGESSADLLTVWPTQITRTWGERLTVPLMASAILSYLPLIGTHYLPFSLFAIANGQCLAFRRAAYEKIGGHASVRDKIIEDVALARRIKRNQLRLRLFDGNRLIYCRMYQNWEEVLTGFGKNIFAGHRNSLFFLSISTVFHWLVFVVPILWLLFALVMGNNYQLPLLIGGGWLLVRAITILMTRQRLGDVLFTPLSVLLMTRIAFRSISWWYRKQTTWKGRIINQPY